MFRPIRVRTGSSILYLRYKPSMIVNSISSSTVVQMAAFQFGDRLVWVEGCHRLGAVIGIPFVSGRSRFALRAPWRVLPVSLSFPPDSGSVPGADRSPLPISPAPTPQESNMLGLISGKRARQTIRTG